LSGEFGSRLKMWTVLMQLGGSVAASVLNLASIATNSLPYLSYYNQKTAVGGGYGEVKSAAALFRALADLRSPKMADDIFLVDMVAKKEWAKYGLTEDEAVFLRDQTEQGMFDAAQFNALVGTARGKTFDNRAQAAIKGWMSMFSYTEQANRRGTGMAAYRLEKERLKSQGGLSDTEIYARAAEASRRAVNISQGEYAMFNRPAMARGNLLQYIFMYKQYVITSVQLLRAMPLQGRMWMLGILLMVSGLKGLPFAEDLFDIFDTILQTLGIKKPSVEKFIMEQFNAIAPGMTPYLMRGVLDRWTSATVSTRLGMGDLLPRSVALPAEAGP